MLARSAVHRDRAAAAAAEDFHIGQALTFPHELEAPAYLADGQVHIAREWKSAFGDIRHAGLGAARTMQ